MDHAELRSLKSLAYTGAAPRVCAPGPTVNGSDISSYNEPPQYPGQFTFIKASEGLSEDSMFASNRASARSHGQLMGFYHFLRPSHTGALQAEFFVNLVGPDAGIGYVMDWEVACPVATALEFMQTVQSLTGRKPIFYSYPAFIEGLGSESSLFTLYPLWIANPGAGKCPHVPTGWPTWLFCQYEFGATPAPDLNLFNGSLDDLKALIK